MEETCCPNKDCHDYDPLTTDNCIKCYTLDQLIPMSEPSSPGWYWYQKEGWEKEQIVEVVVGFAYNNWDTKLFFRSIDFPFGVALRKLDSGQWYGPIKEPT